MVNNPRLFQKKDWMLKEGEEKHGVSKFFDSRVEASQWNTSDQVREEREERKEGEGREGK
jgi:hypothetical protein